MTSSLVGSEMCIRDRIENLPRTFPTGAPGVIRAVTTAPLKASLKGPVSYTHLTLPTICSV
eukprot:7318716-Prorocentrum_lima.AAC.1